MDIELVNQELNFHSPDNNLVIKGGCDLFTTKPIGSDRKLFKTIDKHLDQILEDHQLSQSIERERKHSLNSFLGSSSSPLRLQFVRRGSSYVDTTERERRSSSSLINFSKRTEFQGFTTEHTEASKLSLSLLDANTDENAIDESPFGPLKNASTRKTFAYLIAILNTTYPDHDFSNLQPSTENFHKVDSPEDLMHRFNNIMVSLGKREELLSWIWDTVNAYMDIIPTRSPTLSAQGNTGSRKNSFTNGNTSISPRADSPLSSLDPGCKIYEFQPSDQSILEDLNHPYQTMWSYYWFIYNKKKKRVCFLYLTAINRFHFSLLNRNRSPMDEGMVGKGNDATGKNEDDSYSDEYMEEDDLDEENAVTDSDVIGDLEI